MDVAKPEAQAPGPAPVDEGVEVIVHPLVLLSAVDHYNRVAKGTQKRVVGVLLGTSWKGRIDVTNSFAGRLRGAPMSLPI
jgi:26S proteasome regulatory subunit N8